MKVEAQLKKIKNKILSTSQTSKDIKPTLRYRNLSGGNCEKWQNIIILVEKFNLGKKKKRKHKHR